MSGSTIRRMRRLALCIADIWQTFSYAYHRVHSGPVYCNLYLERPSR